jgi:cytochrome b pre-mRNA-processing protein 3
MGVGDLSVGKKVKGLAQYFYAMAAACREGLKGDDETLARALRQYVYQDIDPPAEAMGAMVDYIRASTRILAEQDAGAIAGGRVRFAAAPGED